MDVALAATTEEPSVNAEPQKFCKRPPPISLILAFRCDRVDSVDLFYLHAPDRNIPLLDTLRAVHELASEGLFREWGISNYAAWETVDIWHICK